VIGYNRSIESFQNFIRDQRFPCVGARAALATGGLNMVIAGDLRNDSHDKVILSELASSRYDMCSPSDFASFAVIFPKTPILREPQFEAILWDRLNALHELDKQAYPWDKSVSSDSASPQFGMSFCGVAVFIIGMHPGSSRYARRAPAATLVFNLHSQFRHLKAVGKYDRMRDVIRARDLALQGANNPMLSDHGIKSEASQYSGRAVSPDWICPFKS
jgi:uncharacterized protein